MTLQNCPWPQGLSQPVLSSAEVHVWCASLDQPADIYASLLSAGELATAQRFHFEPERQRFMVARGCLRLLLGRYLNIPPESLQFTVGAYGKPELSAGLSREALCFNLAHSGGLVLIAITQDHEIGVDLEQLHPIPDVQQLVEQFFSSLERTELAALPLSERLEAFFCGWTRKEAYLKGRGDGLHYPLDQFSVSMACGKPARLLNAKDGPQELSRWYLQTLLPSPGYVGALAVEGHAWRLQQWQMG